MITIRHFLYKFANTFGAPRLGCSLIDQLLNLSSLVVQLLNPDSDHNPPSDDAHDDVIPSFTESFLGISPIIRHIASILTRNYGLDSNLAWGFRRQIIISFKCNIAST
jgi:hypothetical protein